jgi:hypothetical protein
MKGLVNPRRALIAILICILAGVFTLAFFVPPDSYGFIGIWLVAVGVLNVSFHKAFGRQIFEGTRSMPAFVSNFWGFMGQEKIQLLYLGIGTIFAAAGVFLFLRASF